MPEWVFVVALGALGGLLNSVLHRDPWRPATYETHTGQIRTDYGLLGSVLAGMAGASIVWIFEHPDVTPLTPVGTLLPLAGALVSGLGGGRILRSHFSASKQTSAVNETASILEEAATTAIDIVSETTQTSKDPKREAHKDR